MHDSKLFTLNFLQFLLLPLAVFIDSKYQKYEKVYMLVYYVFVFVPMLLSEFRLIFQLTLFIHKVDIFMYVLNTFLIGHSLMTVHKRRRVFVQLHQQIVDSELLDDGFFDRCQCLLKRKFSFWCSFYSFSALLTIIIPFLVALLTEAELGSLPTLFFPFLLPWASNTVSMYMWTMFIQMVMGSIPLCIIAALVFLSSYLEVLLIAMSQYTKDKINTWDRNNKKRRISKRSFSDDVSIEFNVQEPVRIEELKQIFLIHQFMKKLTKDVVGILESYISFGLFQSLFTTALLTACVVLIRNNLGYQLKMICVQSAMSLYLILNCVTGETIMRLNEEMLTSIYETEWYDEPLAVQKQIKLFMILNHRPYVIRMLGTFCVNLSFIARPIKSLYSAIQVISSFPHKL